MALLALMPGQSQKDRNDKHWEEHEHRGCVLSVTSVVAGSRVLTPGLLSRREEVWSRQVFLTMTRTYSDND